MNDLKKYILLSLKNYSRECYIKLKDKKVIVKINLENHPDIESMELHAIASKAIINDEKSITKEIKKFKIEIDEIENIYIDIKGKKYKLNTKESNSAVDKIDIEFPILAKNDDELFCSLKTIYGQTEGVVWKVKQHLIYNYESLNLAYLKDIIGLDTKKYDNKQIKGEYIVLSKESDLIIVPFSAIVGFWFYGKVWDFECPLINNNIDDTGLGLPINTPKDTSFFSIISNNLDLIKK